MSVVKFNTLKLTDVKVVTSDVITNVISVQEKQKIQASDKQANDQFGLGISMNYAGDIAVIGAHTEDTGGVDAGAAYIFTKNSSDIWSEKQKIQASDKQAGDEFGRAPSINDAGDIIVIGADREDTGGSNAGAAYIFTKNSSDIWSEKQKIQASDKQAGDYFGRCNVINGLGNTIIVGAVGEDTGAVYAGAAYIFTKNSSDVWSEKQKIQASDVATDSLFGTSVTINKIGDLAIIGARAFSTNLSGGAAYIFTKNVSDVWSQKQKIISSDIQSGDNFGISVAINDVGDVAVIGASNKNTGAIGAGAAYIFTKNSSDIWSEKQKIQASDPSATAQFGINVSMNGTGEVIAIGAFNEDTIGSNAGATYIFNKNVSDFWSQTQKMYASDIQSNYYFGNSLSLNAAGDSMLIGSVGVSTGGVFAGGAYFRKGTLIDIPIGEGVAYADVIVNEAFRMKSDTVLKIKI